MKFIGKKYVGMAMLCMLMACANSEQKAGADSDSTAQKVDASPVAEVKLNDPEVADIYHAYIDLKNDLVATNHSASQASAKTLAATLKKKQGCENTALIAEKISAAKDIAAQRKEFTLLSADVIAMFKHSDLASGVIYVQHCPMANNGDGGDWLSSSEKIQNPYYGDEMMECGAVVEQIKK